MINTSKKETSSNNRCEIDANNDAPDTPGDAKMVAESGVRRGWAVRSIYIMLLYICLIYSICYYIPVYIRFAFPFDLLDEKSRILFEIRADTKTIIYYRNLHKCLEL